MKKWIITVILIALVGWAVVDFATGDRKKVSQDIEDKKTLEEIIDVGLGYNEVAPDFTLTTLDGEEVSLSDFRGEPVMINFWATWCPPCKAEMPDMQKFYEETGMTIISVNMTSSERSRENVPKFVDEYEITFPVLMDEDSEVSDQYEAYQLPTTYFLDKDGEIHFKLAGPMNYDFMMDKYNELH